MNTTEKQIIVEELKLQAKLTSQNKLAAKLNISSATISQMINGNHALIKNDMWRKAKVNLRLDLGWKIAETSNFKLITKTLQAVQMRSLSIGISENAGIGKTEVYKQYARKYKNVIHIECKNYWSKKSYIKNICNTAGLEAHGTCEELIEAFLDHAKSLENLVMIIDQADKLKDPQLDLFMDFYNELFGHCAFVLSGVKALEKRILKGVQRDKIGYREIWSRIGSKFYDQIGETTLADVKAICELNGVDDQEMISYIFNISEGDIRKVRKEVEKINMRKVA